MNKQREPVESIYYDADDKIRGGRCKARRTHSCYDCGQRIERGERHEYGVFPVSEFRPGSPPRQSMRTFRLCMPCLFSHARPEDVELLAHVHRPHRRYYAAPPVGERDERCDRLCGIGLLEEIARSTTTGLVTYRVTDDGCALVDKLRAKHDAVVCRFASTKDRPRGGDQGEILECR